MSRRDKPHAKATTLKDILSRPARLLTDEEKKERTSFEGFAGNDATPIEPSAFARNRSTGDRWSTNA